MHHNRSPKNEKPSGHKVAKKVGAALLAATSLFDGVAACGNNPHDDVKTIQRSDLQKPAPITDLSDERIIKKDGNTIAIAALMATQNPDLLCKMGIDGINVHGQIEQDLAILNAEKQFQVTDAFNKAKLEPSTVITFKGKKQTYDDAITQLNWDIRYKTEYLPYLIQAEQNVMPIPVKDCNAQYDPANAMFDGSDVKYPASSRVIYSDELLDIQNTYQWISDNGVCQENLDSQRAKIPKIDTPQTWEELDKKIKGVQLQFESYVVGTHIVPCAK